MVKSISSHSWPVEHTEQLPFPAKGSIPVRKLPANKFKSESGTLSLHEGFRKKVLMSTTLFKNLYKHFAAVLIHRGRIAPGILLLKQSDILDVYEMFEQTSSRC